MKYFIYNRKSSEEEGKQLQSLITQKLINLENAKLHNLVVVDIICEKKSAKEPYQRPEFTGMLKRIEKGEADGILVVDGDRLTRNLVEGAILLDMFAKGTLKEIRTRSMVYSSLESLNSLIDKIASATKWSRELQIKVLDGNVTKLSRREYPSNAILGYKNIPGNIIPDERAIYITELCELFSTGEYSLKTLTKLMYEKGLRSRKGNKVQKSVIQRILKNPEYYGVIRRNKKIYPGSHIPLTNVAIFNRNQEILSGRFNGKKQKHIFLYRDHVKAFCEVCGCMLTATLKKGHIYYYCTNGKGGCIEHTSYLREEKLDNLIRPHIIDFSQNKKMADVSFELYVKDLFAKGDTSEIQQKAMLKQQVQIKSMRSNLLDLLLLNKISQEQYDLKNKELSQKESDVQIGLNNLKPQKPEFTLEQVKKVKEDCCNALEMFDCKDDDIKQDLLKSQLWNLTISHQKIINIRYKKPFEYLKDVAKSSEIEIWRRGWDSNPRKLAPHRFSRPTH